MPARSQPTTLPTAATEHTTDQAATQATDALSQVQQYLGEDHFTFANTVTEAAALGAGSAPDPLQHVDSHATAIAPQTLPALTEVQEHVLDAGVLHTTDHAGWLV